MQQQQPEQQQQLNNNNSNNSNNNNNSIKSNNIVEYNEHYKIAMVGMKGVGKSAITIRFIEDTFGDIFTPTIEDTYYIKKIIDDIPVYLEILDVSTHDDYPALKEAYMKNNFGFLFVFDLTQINTLHYLQNFIQQLYKIKNYNNTTNHNNHNKKDYNKHYNNNFSIILLGNKCEINESHLTIETIQNYLNQLSLQFSSLNNLNNLNNNNLNNNNLNNNNLNNLQIFLTSAKNKINIEESFEALIREMRMKKINNLKHNCNNSDHHHKDNNNKNGGHNNKSGSGNNGGLMSGGLFLSMSSNNEKENDLQFFEKNNL